MARYLILRLLQFIPVFLGATFLIYFLVLVMPGDPIAALFGDRQPPQSVIDTIRARYNLDKPPVVQYFLWATGLVTGNFGVAFSGQPVSEILARTLPVSAQLGVMALIISLVIGLTMGLYSGLRPGGVTDRVSLGAQMLALSIPSFVLAYVLQYLLGIQWKIFPVTVGGDSSIYRMVLPALTLGLLGFVGYARIFRGEIMKNREQDFVGTAYSKGLPHRKVVMAHIVRTSLLAIVTMVGMSLAGMISGAIITEGIFNVPGVGNQLYRAVLASEGPTIVSFAAVLTIVFIVMNLVIDLLYQVIDPRIRVTGKK